MKKRFLSILLAAALICALLAVPAAADGEGEAYEESENYFDLLFVNSDEDRIRVHYDTFASGDGWSYDGDSATLTLNGVSDAVFDLHDADRVVTILLADGSVNDLVHLRFWDCHEDVIITGGGTLNLSRKPDRIFDMQGFFNNHSRAKVIVKSGVINVDGIIMLYGDLVIEGGTVTGKSVMVGNFGGDCTVTGGTLILDTEDVAIQIVPSPEGERRSDLEDATIVGAEGEPLSMVWVDDMGVLELRDAAGNTATYAKITAAPAPAEDPAPAEGGEGDAYEEENFFDVLYVGTDADRIRVHYDAVASGDGWSYDGDSATLTLNGIRDAVFDFYDADRAVTILLADGSVNEAASLQFMNCQGGVIITGSGTLNLTVEDPMIFFDLSGYLNIGAGSRVVVNNGVLNIDGPIWLSGELEIAGGTVTGNRGLYGENDGVTVTGGTLILEDEEKALVLNMSLVIGVECHTGLENATIVGADGEPLSIYWDYYETAVCMELQDAAGNPATYAKITAGSAPAPAPSDSIFADVPGDAYYAGAVSWAYNHEPRITTGTSDTEFSPAGHVTRAQAVTFLWRVKGCPEPESPVSDFSDVQDPGSWYYKAVLWAVEQGITNGTGNGQFSPDKGVTRGQMITFLYRTMGEPGKTGAGEWYADAENWARQNGLLDGTAAAYETNGDCPRSDVVYYLWKQLAE